MTESKPCEHCGQPMERQPHHNDYCWDQKTTCSMPCRKALYAVHGGAGREREYTVAEIEEIEQRKVEVRRAAVGHLRLCLRD